jgi:hypothetical protein
LHRIRVRKGKKNGEIMKCSNDVVLSQLPLGMAYVPMQKFNNMFENLDKAYRTGTIFTDLDKPFTGRRCVK